MQGQGQPNRVGEILGNYRLMKLLGKGGYAEVYLAENIHLGIQTAIKVLKARVLQETEQEQFRFEANLMMTLDHPHIVRVLDFGIDVNRRGVDGSTPYLVMEYAPLGTLRHLYPRGTPMPLPKIASYIKQIAEALQYAHDRNPEIVHRDVKPENMLVRRPDDVALSDFGIAVSGLATGNLERQIQQILEKIARNEQVTIPGTAVYLAPERIQGHTRRTSDQYSLAIVAYEWLCGYPPFDGSDVEICSKHKSMQPPLLSRNFPHVPQEVERVVMKALAKEPGDRYKSVLEFAHALENAARPTIQKASPVPPIVQPRQQPPPPAPGPLAAPTIAPGPRPGLQPQPTVLKQPAAPAVAPGPRPGLQPIPSTSNPSAAPTVQPDQVPPIPVIPNAQRPNPSERVKELLTGGVQPRIVIGGQLDPGIIGDRTVSNVAGQGLSSSLANQPNSDDILVTAKRILSTDTYFLKGNRWFFPLGIALNVLSVLLMLSVPPLLLSLCVGIIGAGLAIFMQRRCMISVKKPIAIVFGAGTALWWGYVGANVATHIPNPEALFFGFFFPFAIGLGLHVWYVLTRLNNN